MWGSIGMIWQSLADDARFPSLMAGGGRRALVALGRGNWGAAYLLAITSRWMVRIGKRSAAYRRQ